MMWPGSQDSGGAMKALMVGETRLGAAAGDWRALATLMEQSARDLGALSAGVLPGRAQGSGAAFAEAWAGFAAEAHRRADGLADALEETLRDFRGVEREVVESLARCRVPEVPGVTAARPLAGRLGGGMPEARR